MPAREKLREVNIPVGKFPRGEFTGSKIFHGKTNGHGFRYTTTAVLYCKYLLLLKEISLKAGKKLFEISLALNSNFN